uniref:Uncharacterized protein n=1 Tax=Sphaerodactylus townsendi TaxID=933632 RepID=A0ACB8FT50_9SAUR
MQMPPSISACQGLRVHVPCQFTFPHQASSEDPRGYWFKKESLGYPARSRSGRLVASSDKKAAIDRSAANRFQFVGDPKRGNCSFSITNAQREDEGRYYFRIEQGDLKYTYVNHDDQIHTSPAIFVSGCLPVVKE